MSPRARMGAIRWRTKWAIRPAPAEPQSAASAVPASPPAVVQNSSVRRGGSVVYAPVPEASDLQYSPPPEQRAVQQSAPPAAAMPNADEVSARGGVAALHLDLHVYATQPQQRFIFVNARKYKEGDTLAEGPLVEQITPDGAVLNFRGSRFKLSND
jgi:general secretion pathway protein B